MDSLITVKTFTYAHEAAVARSLLHAEDIFCFLKDELTIQANPFYSNALGGVKLQVRQQDVARAADILKTYATGEPQTIAIRTATGALDECPACESQELSLIRKPSKGLFGLSLLFLGFPLSLFSRVYHCYGCCRDIRVTRR
jgi:hypothetical protein